MILAFVGAIALTIALGYLASILFFFAFCAFMGIDEYNPGVGIICTLVGLIPCVAWWYMVGSHLHISVR